ncbi:hypothetical protein K504DRAFT_390429 [Pleomassaria siparia CBS 279.74]|uniref:SEC7 domain-containing protein n=1 Tax=Pleomassaria siparia CBS 279.74 TaxID=1314801 RepID=A0A6G1JVG2_9PLEO|nr:hypothetical protein K504DRAFT_390429 [Pleomassaria siparia CBS 279.74]
MADLNSSTGLRHHSPPTTPTASSSNPKHGAMRPPYTRPTQNETFFHDTTPADNLKSGQADHKRVRDSHDLSFADGTRDSVVDNMLLSLDQLPAALFSDPATLYSSFDNDDFLLTDNHYPPPRPTRYRGHTYASSHSSDYDVHIDDTSSRYSSHHSHGRRSNSSNNIPTMMSRRGSLRGGYPGVRDKPSNSLFGDFHQTSHSRSAGTKGSSSSSMDYGAAAVLGTHRLGGGNRSASFDHGNPRTAPLKTESILDRSRAAHQNYHHDYDAAPEPTIPAGPRRIQELPPPQSPMSYPAQSGYAAPQVPGPRRRGSIRSTASRTLRKNKSQPEPNMRMQAQEFVNASNLRDLPPIPAYQGPSAPSPTVATRKPTYATSSTPLATLTPTPTPTPTPTLTPTALAIPKEKPGFFRRVFGGGGNSSKNQPQLSNSSMTSNASHGESSPTSLYNRPNEIDSTYPHTRPRTTPSGSNHIASQIKSVPQPPHTASSGHGESQQQQQPAPPTLAKKHSSFFRRRKKSVSDSPKVPIMAVEFRPRPQPQAQPQPQPEFPSAQPSTSISSLRQVMNPYFNDLGSPGYHDTREQRTMGETKAGGEEVVVEGFSPGYKAHRDATVRTVKPGSGENESAGPSSRDQQQQQQVKTMNSLDTSSSKLKLKMKIGKTVFGGNMHEETFLADSSSCNEDGSGRVTPSGEKTGAGGVDETRRRSTSPTTRFVAHGGGKSAHDPPKAIVPSVDSSAGTSPSPSLSLSLSPSLSQSLSQSQSASEVEHDSWIMTGSDKVEQTRRDPKQDASRSRRVWLEPTSSEENLDVAEYSMVLPLEGARSSQKSFEKASPPISLGTSTPLSDIFHSASSLPVVHVQSHESDDMPAIIEHHQQHDDTEPTEADRTRARMIFTGDDPSGKAQAATILGDVTIASTRMRKAYMQLFDWSGFNILSAMRDMCGKLVLKAETQQVDRILMSLSERWCECNPNHGFKAMDVVHTICYSILLLNTDLHVADIESRMTRSQFIKNTLPTIVRVCREAIKEAADETLRPQSTQFRRGSIPWGDRSEPNSPAPDATSFPPDISDEPLEGRRARSRLSVKPPRSGSEGLLSTDSAGAEGNALIHAPYVGSMKGWEYQIELVLKDFYSTIRHQRLPLHGSTALQVHEQQSSNNLSVSGMLRRTPSVLSKAPSENMSYRGRSHNDFRSVGNRWVSKTRSRPRLYPTSTVASSRTSLDDTSVWSPAGSSSWSRYSYGKTQTSMSMDSLGSHFAHGDYQQAIGFANALSQAIIREEGIAVPTNEEFTRVAPLLEDETLELIGAPWAKEGILKHKRHLESLDKKAKDRTWNESFAVIEKGYMRLFSFNMNSKSMRLKNKSRPSAGSIVGGGNWMDNAEALDSFLLRQSIASALPPPGYSKSRPHVWALSLPTGAVHLFQVGTPDIVREFVTTANYWSARLSKEPLVGGISNIEYGWGDNVINPALIPSRDRSHSTQTPVHGHGPRPSMASSMRSSVDHATGVVKPRLPGDKVNLSDWTPPTQSMMASNLMEVDQLRALSNYVKNVEEELSRHNELRAPMLIAFSPRHPNAAKAMANWERKSSYLLREIVKFRTYIDSLNAAQTNKDRIYAQRKIDAENNPELNAEDDDTKLHPVASEIDGADEPPKSSEPIAA